LKALGPYFAGQRSAVDLDEFIRGFNAWRKTARLHSSSTKGERETVEGANRLILRGYWLTRNRGMVEIANK